MSMNEKNDISRLIVKAEDAQNHSYAPYSNFKVGAVIQGEGGKIYSGCNVENASYGLSICAERGAVFNAISGGEKTFNKIVILTDTENPITPCGACRQVLM